MNIDTKELLKQAKHVDKVLKWINKMSSVMYKIYKEGEDEVLARRKTKLEENSLSEDYSELADMKYRLLILEGKIDVAKPLVFDSVQGKIPENHENLSKLTDEYKELDEHYNDSLYKISPEYRAKYTKIYDIQLNGAEIDVIKDVIKTFSKLQKGKITSTQGAIHGSKFSEDKYSLPKGFYAPLIDYKSDKKNKYNKKK
jgi:hypothetical protein